MIERRNQCYLTEFRAPRLSKLRLVLVLASMVLLLTVALANADCTQDFFDAQDLCELAANNDYEYTLCIEGYRQAYLACLQEERSAWAQD